MYMKQMDIVQLVEGNDYPTAGQLFFNVMEEVIPNGDVVVVDMAGVDALPSMFLNMSIGKYLEKYGSASLSGKLKFKNITASQVRRIKEYMSRF